MTTVERKFVIHELAANELRQATAAAAALRNAGQLLTAQAEQVYAGAVAPVLQMLGIPQGNITDVSHTPDGYLATVIVPVPVDAPKPKLEP